MLPECLPRVVPLDWGEFLPQIKSGLWAHSSLRQPACSRQQGRTNSSAWLSYGEIEGNSSCSLIKNQAPGPPATLPVDQLESDERASESTCGAAAGRFLVTANGGSVVGYVASPTPVFLLMEVPGKDPRGVRGRSSVTEWQKMGEGPLLLRAVVWADALGLAARLGGSYQPVPKITKRMKAASAVSAVRKSLMPRQVILCQCRPNRYGGSSAEWSNYRPPAALRKLPPYPQTIRLLPFRISSIPPGLLEGTEIAQAIRLPAQPLSSGTSTSYRTRSYAERYLFFGPSRIRAGW